MADVYTVVEKFNPHHDRAGRFSSTTAGRIAAGHEVKVTPDQVGAIVDTMRGRKDHPNLTLLNVQGTHLFNQGGKHVREDMPQVPSHRKAEFVDAMKERGVKVERVSVDPLSLKASQGEISGSSVADIAHRERKGEGRVTGDAARITISSDGYVLDGHHRWAAAAVMALDDPTVMVPAYRMDQPKARALNAIRTWNADADIKSLALGEQARKALLLKGIQVMEKFNHAHDRKGRFASTAEHAAARETGVRGEHYVPMAPEFDSWPRELQRAYTGAIDDFSGINQIKLLAFAEEHGKKTGMSPKEAETYSLGVARRAGSAHMRREASTPAGGGLSFDRTSYSKAVDELRKDGRPTIAVHEGAALDILHGGRFQSQFETGTSNGMLAPKERAAAEVEMFNHHPATPPEKRTVYGFVAMPGLEGQHSVDQYGAVRFVLKDDVKSRSTMTIGDSLSTFAMPLPMTGKVTAPQRYDAAAVNRGGRIRDVLSTHGHNEFSKYQYAEAQIHGGVDIADIAEVHVPESLLRSGRFARNGDGTETYHPHPVIQSAMDLGIPVVPYSTSPVMSPKRRKAAKVAVAKSTVGALSATRADGARLYVTDEEVGHPGGGDRWGYIVLDGQQFEPQPMSAILARGYWDETTVAKYNEHHDAKGRFSSTSGHAAMHTDTPTGEPLPPGWGRETTEGTQARIKGDLVSEGIKPENADRVVARMADRGVLPTVYTDGKVTIITPAGKDGLDPQHHGQSVRQAHFLQQVAPVDNLTIRISDAFTSEGSGRTLDRNVIGWTSMEHPGKAGHATMAIRPIAWTDRTVLRQGLTVGTGGSYVMAHEWGHAVKQPKALGSEKEQALYSMFSREGAQVSAYAMSKPAEMYAEMFADWHGSMGKTTRPVVRRAAKEFGWFEGDKA